MIGSTVSLNNKQMSHQTWVNIFGNHIPEIMPLDLSEDPFELYSRISQNYAHSFLFESLTGPEELAETSVMGFDPQIILRGYTDHVDVIRNDTTSSIRTSDPFAELKKLLRRSDLQDYRYVGGAVGAVNYDAVRLVEDIPDRHSAVQPVMEFGIYDDGIIYDHLKKKLFYFYHDKNRIDEFAGCNGAAGKFSATVPRPNMNLEEFSRIVQSAKQYIHDGDIFQVVLSRKFTFGVEGDHTVPYGALRRLNPSPYMYHLKQAGRTIIGASPEMLVRVTRDTVETFPIAGTRKITSDEARNRQLADELLADEKELAEHTMLVDLGRNDIGRVCRYGTVPPHIPDADKAVQPCPAYSNACGRHAGRGP